MIKYYFIKQYLLIFIIKTAFVLCETAAEILSIMYTNVNPQKNKLSIRPIKLTLHLHNIHCLIIYESNARINTIPVYQEHKI